MSKEVFFIDRQKEKGSFHIKDRSLPPLDLTRKLNDPIYKFNHRAKNLLKKDDNFIFPEYNFSDLSSLIELEPFIARTFDRKALLCLKEGFQILSKNQKVVDYIKVRFLEMEGSTGISIDTLIEEAVVGLIRFSNHFFVFERSKKHSSGNRRRTPSGMLDPIAGIFSVPVETVTMRFDERGDCDAIRQNLHGSFYYLKQSREMKKFDRNHFVHFSMWPQSGLSVSTPILIGVQDDISALRKLEENVEILYYQYLFPLYHYKIGTPEAPAAQYPDGRSEVQQAREEITELPSEGCVVTSERHQIEVVGAKSSALDPTPILEWYKKRILAGILASALDLGEGDTANRSTSDTLSRLTVDFCKYIQKKVSYFFENLIFKELLLESSFTLEEINLPENKPSLFFNEIDLDSVTKKENHFAQLFSQNILTHDEIRQSIGRDVLSEEEKKGLLINISMQDQMDLEQTKGAESAGESKSRPSNQYGQKANSEKRRSSILFESLQSTNPLLNKNNSLIQPWLEVKEKIPESGSKHKESYLFIAFELIRESFYSFLYGKFKEGFEDVLKEEKAFRDFRIETRDFLQVKTELKRLFDKLKNEILQADSYDKFDWRFRLIEQAEQARSYNFGRLRAYKALGREKVSVVKKDVKLKELFVIEDYVNIPPSEHPQSEEYIL